MNFVEEALEWFRTPSDSEGRGSPRSGIGVLTPLLEKFHGTYQGAPVKDAMIAVAAAAVPLPRVDDALSVTLQVQGAAIRYTFTGGAPTPTNGFRADIGTIITVEGVQSLWGFQAIQEGASAATLAATFWA